MAGIAEGIGICAVRAVVGFGEQAGRPYQFTSKMKVTFCAGDEAAPARSPKPPRRAGQGGGLQLSVAVQHAENGREDVEQSFQELDHHEMGVGLKGGPKGPRKISADGQAALS